MGDCIQNYKTVQSLGYDDVIIKTFADLIEPICKINKTRKLKFGLIYGFTQFIQYLIFGGLFYAAGVILENNPED